MNDRFTLKAAGMETEINGQGNGAGQGDDPYLYDHCQKSIEVAPPRTPTCVVLGLTRADLSSGVDDHRCP